MSIKEFGRISLPHSPCWEFFQAPASRFCGCWNYNVFIFHAGDVLNYTMSLRARIKILSWRHGYNDVLHAKFYNHSRKVSFAFRFVVSHYMKYPKLTARDSVGGNFNNLFFCSYAVCV